MINHTATSADEDVDTASELVGLVLDVSTTIDGKHVILTIVSLQGMEFLANLDGELSCGGQNHGLGSAGAEKFLCTKANDHGKTESKGLPGTSKVSYNQVLFISNSVECFVLDGEKFSDATGYQTLNGASV